MDWTLDRIWTELWTSNFTFITPIDASGMLSEHELTQPTQSEQENVVSLTSPSNLQSGYARLLLRQGCIQGGIPPPA